MADEGFQGMAQLISALQRLPEQLKTDAHDVVEDAAIDMKAEVDAVYDRHRVTGNLAAGTRIEREGPLRIRVRNRERHVHLFERGTVVRQTRSTGAHRGAMPARPTFVPAAVRHRQRMWRRLSALLRRMRVPGMTGTPEVRET